MKVSTCAIALTITCHVASAFVSPSTFVPIKDVGRSSVSSTKQLYATINVDEEAPRDTDSIEEWSYSYGIGRADGIQLVGENLDGFLDVHVESAQDLPAGSSVMYIPNEVILSSNRAIAEFGRLEEAESLLVGNGVESEIREFYLMLKILVELEKGEESPYYHYFEGLPRFFANGASMTPFCYRCLPPFAVKLCQKERVKLNHVAFGCKSRVQFLSEKTRGDSLLWEWAFQIVYTRSFEAPDGSGDLCLYPIGDMFNHATDSNVAYAYDEDGNCYAQTTRDVAAGEPLTMTYSDPTNPSYLLARYGFLDESSPASFCKLGVDWHISDELVNMGYSTSTLLFYKDTGEVSEQVWDVLLYKYLGDVDVGRQQEFYQAHMNGDYETKQSYHECYYEQTREKLLEHIDDILGELDGLSQKSAYGGAVAGDDHPRLPLILRHNDFVRATFMAVRSYYFPGEPYEEQTGSFSLSSRNAFFT
ncbi:hypothetical protein ACHAWT_006491 [Skeletonema menzelii]